MILKTFTSIKSPLDAVEKANIEIEKMRSNKFEVDQIEQSESSHYNSFAEEVQFHFTITILFRNKAQ